MCDRHICLPFEGAVIVAQSSSVQFFRQSALSDSFVGDKYALNILKRVTQDNKSELHNLQGLV